MSALNRKPKHNERALRSDQLGFLLLILPAGMVCKPYRNTGNHSIMRLIGELY
jgi:hypothetical protein